MRAQIEYEITDLQERKYRIEEFLHYQQTDFLNNMYKQLINNLENARIYNSQTESKTDEFVMQLKSIINRNQDLVSASLYKNIQVLKAMSENEPFDLISEARKLDELKAYLKNDILKNMDSTQLSYNFITSLGINYRSEIGSYINKTVISNVNKFADEFLINTTNIIDNTIEMNLRLNNEYKRREEEKQQEIQNKENDELEIIIIKTSENRQYTVEKYGDEMRLKIYKATDALAASKMINGPEADWMYSELAHTLNRENQIEIMVIKTSENKEYTIEKIGNDMRLREYQAADSFDASKLFTGPEADALYQQLQHTMVIQESNKVIEDLPSNVIK